MKIVQKLSLVLSILIICQFQLAASSHTHFTKINIDTIPIITPEYKGNRIIVKSIKVVKKKGKTFKIEYKLVNNGRNKIKLGKASSIPKDLIIEFDNSLAENDLVEAKSSIIESIKKQSISIRPGQLIMGNKLKFTHQPIPITDRIATKLEEIDSSKKVVDEDLVENRIFESNEKVEDPKLNEITKTKFDEAVKDIVEEIPLPNSELENPRIPSQSAQPSQESPLDETILVKEKDTSKKVEINETESILNVLPKKNSEKIVEEISEKQIELSQPESLKEDNIIISEMDTTNPVETVDSISNMKNEVQENVEFVEEKNQTEIIIEEETENNREKLCADLIIENVEILKKNKRFVMVKYTIKNIGNIPISLHGETKKEMDNIAIQSHFTRSHNLTRGSIPVDISFIKKGNKDVKGMLVPGESISKKLKIETSKVTKFTPVLALTLNPTATNSECSRLNNVFFIDIAEKAPEAINSMPKKTVEEGAAEKITTLEN